MKRSIIIDGTNIDYYLIDPTGNITILVESFVCKENHPYIAKRLMEAEKSCEQVGFIMRAGPTDDIVDITSTGEMQGNESDIDKNTAVDITLRMSAGEFCGNATMSTAALFCKSRGLAANAKRTVCVRASGVANPVKVDITCIEPDVQYKGRVAMPAPLSVDTKKFSADGNDYILPLVDFGGIKHAIVMIPAAKEDNADTSIDSDYTLGAASAFRKTLKANSVIREHADAYIRKWCNDNDYEGFGLIFVDITKDYVNMSEATYDFETDSIGDRETAAGYECDVNPLVYVPGCGTCFWESSCGSGTTALAAYLAGEYFGKNVAGDFDGKSVKNVSDFVGKSVSNVGDFAGVPSEKLYTLKAHEPGGVLTVTVSESGLYMLGGSVKFR